VACKHRDFDCWLGYLRSIETM